MEFRQVLCLAAVLVAATAGCATTAQPTLQPPDGDVDIDDDPSTETPTPIPFAIPQWMPRDEGNVTVVEMQVWNKADWRRGVNVTVVRTVDGTDVRGSTELVLGANETASTEVVLDVPYEDYRAGSDLSFERDPFPP